MEKDNEIEVQLYPPRRDSLTGTLVSIFAAEKKHSIDCGIVWREKEAEMGCIQLRIV